MIPTSGETFCIEPAGWIRLPARAESVSEGRRLVAAFDGLTQAAVGDAQLVVSELLMNALRHAGLEPSDSVGLRLTRHGRRLRIDVRDGGDFAGSSDEMRSLFPAHRRGLGIVSELTVHWQAADGIASAWIEIER